MGNREWCLSDHVEKDVAGGNRGWLGCKRLRTLHAQSFGLGLGERERKDQGELTVSLE